MPANPVQRPSHRRDPGTVIARQIEALTEGWVCVTLKGERTWASISFAGTRYSLLIERAATADPNAMQELAQTLADHEFDIPGYFVADMLVTEQSECRLLVEALAIIDPADVARDH